MLILGGLAVVVAAVAVWWALSATTAVRAGSFSSVGPAGHEDQCSFPDDDFWALFARDEPVVAEQTVRSDARWPVEVTSLRPDVFRFEPLARGPSDPFMSAKDGAPSAAETSDRVVIPPGREATLWVVGWPWDDGVPIDGEARMGVDSAPVRVRALGISRDTEIDLEKSLWLSGLDSGSDEFRNQVQELCPS
ncbi:hypothetical protein [Isoptericola sp. NPDC057559]|uniref:hypothetical protein n=1 Tax=Isoptericola sp. NPDC057559 TaxID=3346168 RepID=UPI0036B7C443